jgi:hypothetical protein
MFLHMCAGSIGIYSGHPAPGVSGEVTNSALWPCERKRNYSHAALFGLVALGKAGCHGLRRSAQTLANEVPRCGPEPENPAQLRQKALRARRLARTLPGDEASKRLDDYADELEDRARAIERERRLVAIPRPSLPRRKCGKARAGGAGRSRSGRGSQSGSFRQAGYDAQSGWAPEMSHTAGYGSVSSACATTAAAAGPARRNCSPVSRASAAGR